MKPPKDKIGIQEFVALILLSIGVKLTDDTAALLYDKFLNSAWMAPIITGMISIIPIFFLIKVVGLRPGKSLMDTFQEILGKHIGYIIILVIWMIGTFSIVIDSAIYVDIIGTMYFTQTPTIFLYFTLMAVSAYGAKKGLEQIGSVAWAALPYIKVSLLVALALTIFKGQVEYIFPLFGPGKWEIVKESSLKLSLFGDFLYIGFIASYMSNQNAYRKGSWIALAILIIEISVSIFSYLILFDYESVKLLNYPYHETIRYISIGFITNIETFFFPFWLVASFIRFSFYLYLSAILFGWLFKIKQFELTIPSLATLIVFLGMLPESPTFTIFNIRDPLLNHVITPIFFALPILLWLMAKFKGVWNNEKNMD
jgi:spore germination protein KB